MHKNDARYVVPEAGFLLMLQRMRRISGMYRVRIRECASGREEMYPRPSVMSEELQCKPEVEQDITSFSPRKYISAEKLAFARIHGRNAKVATKILAICIIY